METNSLGSAPITFQDVLQLVELIKSSAAFSELRIRSGDIEIDLRRGASSAPIAAASPPVDVVAPAPAVVAASRTAASPSSPVWREGVGVVKAPMVGTIYRAPEPGAAPFVKVGQQVVAGDQLCIIEVMKLMNAVVAESAGTLTEILVADGEAVEFGQGLFVVSPR